MEEAVNRNPIAIITPTRSHRAGLKRLWDSLVETSSRAAIIACVDPDQVALLNQGFTPSPAEVAQARSWIEAFDARPAGQTHANAGSLLIDAALADAARNLLSWSQACAARDHAKSQALTQAGATP